MEIITFAATSNVLRVKILDSASLVGAGKTGLTSASSGLIISTIADNEATATAYTAAGSTIETITTLGTYAAPTATKCRFKEVDATNHPGVYEIQLADARFAVASSKRLTVSIIVTGGVQLDKQIGLKRLDMQDAVRAGLTALPNAAANAANGLPSNGTGSGQISLTSGQVLLQTGTGTGQLDFTSGVLKGNMVQLLGTGVPTPAGNQVGYIPCNVYYGAGVLVEDPGDPPAWYTAPDNTGIGTLLTRLSSARAGYLDNLNVGGAVASQADVTSINQSASRRVILTTVGQYERPETGTVTYTIEATTYSRDGVLMDATGDPTLTSVGPITGSLAANLSAVDNPQTGYYRWTYTVAAAATKEEIRFGFSGVVDGDTITLPVYSQVVDLVSATWTTSDRTLLTNISNKLPSKAYLAGTANSDGDPEASDFTGNFPGSVASVVGAVGSVTGNVGGTVGSVVGAVGSIATGGITTASFATGAINAAAIATDAIGADEVAAGAVTKIQAGLVKVGTSFRYTNDNSLVNEEVTITANP